MSRPDGSTALPAQLWGRIFGHLKDDRERCRVVPLVCQHFNSVHNQFPPLRDRLHISTSVDRSLVAWCKKLAPRLVSISMRSGEGAPTPGYHAQHLPQLLALASVEAPNLQHVVIAMRQAPSSQVMNSLGYLSHITHLELARWKIRLSSGVEEVQQMSGLRSLQSLVLVRLDLKESGSLPGQDLSAAADAMWMALATLPSLHRIYIGLSEAVISPDDRQNFQPRYPYFFNEISRMTGLRQMELGNVEHCIEQPKRIHASLPALTQLTALSVTAPHTCQEYRPLAALPQLIRLELVVILPTIHHQNLGRLLSTSLTKLCISGDERPPHPASVSALPMEVRHYLDESSPALPHLRELSLNRLGLDEVGFNPQIAALLSGLTHLTMGMDNHLRLPPELSSMTSLNVLAFPNNKSLQLGERELHLLASLPCLVKFDVSSSGVFKNWSPTSVIFFLALARDCPHLVLCV